MENQFFFNDNVKRFGTYVVVAVLILAHNRLDSVLPQHGLVFISMHTVSLDPNKVGSHNGTYIESLMLYFLRV